jgi:hypothetical protein
MMVAASGLQLRYVGMIMSDDHCLIGKLQRAAV